jgi:mannose-1-phosphate guanylyltransferase / mannose-6-phosphate isomerase
MIEEYLIKKNRTIREVMQKIDENKKRFCIVIDKNNKLCGTVTDGDIRRGILQGKKIEDSVDSIQQKDYSAVKTTDDFRKITNIFQNPRILFIPIVDENNVIQNVITKRQAHVLTLQETDYDPEMCFDKLDESILDHQIVQKPWGYYKTVFLNKSSRIKVLQVIPNGSLSLQQHRYRNEHWVVVSGKGKVTIGDYVKKVGPGDYIWVPRGCKHRLENVEEKGDLMIAEIQLGTSFDEEDITRFEDKYNRVEEK